MGELSSKLYKNKNNTDISDLSELHENILKKYKLNLFKEIAVDFNHSLQMTSESSVSFSDGLFIQIGKCCYYPYIQFILSVAQSFLGLSLNHTSHNNQDDCNLGS